MRGAVQFSQIYGVICSRPGYLYVFCSVKPIPAQAIWPSSDCFITIHGPTINLIFQTFTDKLLTFRHIPAPAHVECAIIISLPCDISLEAGET